MFIIQRCSIQFRVATPVRARKKTAQSNVLEVRRDTRSVSLLSLHGQYMNTTINRALSCMVDVFLHVFSKRFEHT